MPPADLFEDAVMRERLAAPLRGPTRDGMDVRSAGGVSQRQTGVYG